MHRLIVQIWLLILAPWLFAHCAYAAFILDDFDDSMEAVLPGMESQNIVTAGVGALNAQRTIRVSALQTDPIGAVDVSITRSSHFTTRIDGQLADGPSSLPILDINIDYDFGVPTDLSGNGENNALFIDMAVFQGSGIPNSLLLTGIADVGFVASVSRGILLSDSPYTIALRFPFGPRGGGEPADMSMVGNLGLRIRLLQGGRDPDTNWLVQIDRIRVGRIIPEPSTWVLLLLSIAESVSFKRSWRSSLWDASP